MTDGIPTAAEIQAGLVSWLRWRHRHIVMTNVHIKGSPWESDVVTVTAAYYWHEFEIKVSVADFRQDFQKRVSRFSTLSQRKHDLYQQNGKSEHHHRIPVPKTFSFVVPRGLLEHVNVPEHCGIVEYADDRKWSYWHVKPTRPAPILPRPTKLSASQLFNLAWKTSQRLVFQAPAQ